MALIGRIVVMWKKVLILDAADKLHALPSIFSWKPLAPG
jgi:hypothetical protein